MAEGEIEAESPELGRLLATVMFTDMVGYSELTQRDEAEALRLLNEHRRIVRPLLNEYHGREVKTIGDAFMVEFRDPVAAVRCALAIQQKQAERNRDPTVTEVTIRIGLHSGTVIHQEGDLFGDTVNVASRIEPLAPPGGVCLSGPVYDAAHASLDVVAVPVGPATLKNIHLPVPVYRIDLRPERNVPVREGPWIDREEELRGLENALEGAIEGRGRLALISGESGLGKTRLAEQLIRAATRRAARVLWGRASEEMAATPYSLWVRTIQELAEEVPPEMLRESSGEYAAELQRLVPTLSLTTETLTPVPDAELDRARDRLFSGVARLFRELARDRPIVLLLDDLQWADSGSLRLLESFARTVPEDRVLLLALHWPEPKGSTSVLAEVLARLSDLPGTIRVDLTSLPLAAVRQLVLALVKSKAIPDDFVRRLFEKTGGNPYFIGEVVRSLREGGILAQEAGQPFPRLPENLPLPDSVRRLVRQRIDRIDETLRGFLRTLAVLGSEFRSEPLPRLTSLDNETLIDRLGTAVALGLLTEQTDEHGVVRYSFPDRLVWETLYADTPITRRVRDHLRAGEALEALGRSGQDVPATELAYHFQRAQATERALEYTLRAAEEAGRLFAREEAVRHYRSALVLLEGRPEERTRARVQEALGDHLYRLGQIGSSQDLRKAAITAYERLGGLREAGNLHRKIAHGMRDDPASARHHWEEARRLLEAGPPTVELARLYTTIAGYHYEDGDAPEAVKLYGRAVEVARAVEDPLTQITAQIVLSGVRPVQEAEGLFDDLRESLKLAEQHQLQDIVSNLYMVLALARLHVRGDGPGAEEALAHALAVARRAQDVYSERAIEGNLVTYVAWRLGEYERALRAVAAHAQYAGGDPRKIEPTALLVDADIALTRGDGERVTQDLEEAGALLEGDRDWSERVHLRNVRGRSELRRGRTARAREQLRQAIGLAVRAGVPALMAALHAETLHLEIDAATREGDSEAAQRALAALESLSEAAGQPTIRAYATRARGADLARRGDLAGGIASLEEANALWERVGWKYELAQSQLLLAGMYRGAGATSKAEELATLAQSYLERIHASAT